MTRCSTATNRSITRWTASRSLAAWCAFLASCATPGSEPAPDPALASLSNPKLIHAGPSPDLKADGTAPAWQPSVAYFGGPMLQAPELYGVFWGRAVPPTTQASITSFLGSLAMSTIDPMLAEYDTTSPAQTIVQAQFAGTVTDLDAPADTSITDQQIQIELTRLIDAGLLPANDGNKLYVVFFSPGVMTHMPFGTSCKEFCGYHSSFYRNESNAFYAALPDMSVDPCRTACGYDPTPINDLYLATSHEVSEAITDAGTGMTITGMPSYAWLDRSTGYEIGDFCAGLSFTSSSGLLEQREWSNAAQGCVDRAQMSTSSIAVTPGQLTLPIAGTASLDVAATGSLALSVGTFALPAGVTASVSPAQISGGQSATVTLTSTAAASPSTAEIGVYAVDANGTVHLAYPQLVVQGSAPTLSTVALIGQMPGSPVSGPSAGGQELVLTGTNLGGIRTMTFGGTPAYQAAVAESPDGTHLWVATPGHPAGVVDIEVITPDGQTATLPASYTFELSPAPTLTSVSASLGPARGGRHIKLTGTNFAAAANFVPQVTFGGVPAAVDVHTWWPTHIDDVTVPPHAAGTVDIVVTNGDGQSATLPAAYTYADVTPPVVTALSQWAGPSAGGQYVMVQLGDVIGTSPDVRFGDTPATVVSVGPTFVAVRTPAHASGSVDVSVTDRGETTVLQNAYRFQ
jgi:hypothetical protein